MIQVNPESCDRVPIVNFSILPDLCLCGIGAALDARLTSDLLPKARYAFAEFSLFQAE